MLDFDFTEEQKMIRRTVRDFSSKKIKPVLSKMDEDKRIPDPIIEALGGMGYLGMTFDKDLGGMEADPVTVGIVAEELARADISCAVPTFFLVEASWGYIMNKYGTPEVKKEFLPDVCRGRSFIGIAATEPDTGSDLAGMRTIARKEADRYILNGRKLFISGISEASSQLPAGGGHVTLARTDTEKGNRGISLFYVPLKDKEGITTTAFEDWGRRGISAGGFGMDNVHLPEHYLIGEENKGFYHAMEGFDYARAIIAAVCCGSAMSALDQAMDYIKMRNVFGRPIASYEGVQFKLAEAWTKMDAARLLAYKALWAYGKEQSESAYDRFEVTRLCAEAKYLAATSAFDAINEALQWFGAFGYTTGCPLGLALKGVRSYYWAEGAMEIMKTIISRELLGKEYLAYK